jgi:hypothetical protein
MEENYVLAYERVTQITSEIYRHVVRRISAANRKSLFLKTKAEP